MSYARSKAQVPEDERDDRCLRQGHDYVERDRLDGWITFQCAYCGAESQEEYSTSGGSFG